MIQKKYGIMRGSLNERTRRLWAVAEAQAIGYGGASLVARATGISRRTIVRGLGEQRDDGRDGMGTARLRKVGGGRKSAIHHQPDIRGALERLVDPESRGDPQSPLRWTSKSTRHLTRELQSQGYRGSDWLIRQLLYQAGYSLQGNQKTREGAQHPDRDAQFRHIQSKIKSWMKRQSPAISVDTKKKELVGDFKNGGREWRPKGTPVPVRVHDFMDAELGKAIPYGVYDLARNAGWVSVGVDHDTAQFAVNTIRTWWKRMGRVHYARSRELLVMADGGGSNGSRLKLWKWELQKLADQTGLTIHVCHLPPGTSKWNKIEHRLFSFISQNWRGKPLRTLATVVNLISHTRTQTGLKVSCVLDRKKYPSKIQISEKQMKSIRLSRDAFHGEWNYHILPKNIS